MNPRRPTPPAPRSLRLRPLALSLACIGLAPAGAQTVPTGAAFPLNGGTVSVGAPTALGNGGLALGIQQASQRAIINWQSFSIGAKDQVNIRQDMGASSVLLNRVVNGGPRSEIQGLLSAPGSVYVVNPAGVLFGPTAQVNVGGLVASALGMTTSDGAFMEGARRIEFGGVAQDSVVNEGTINIATGGTAALLGNIVTNRGSIRADGGTVALAAGGKVVVDFAGDGLTTFRVSAGPDARATNVSGTLQADGGRVVMLGAAATNVEGSGGVVNFRGLIRANSLGTRNGEVVLDAGDAAEGVFLAGGTISAAGTGAGQRGGSIEIKGRTIGLQPFDAGGVFTAIPPPRAPGADDSGVIDASGSAGGGRVLLHAVAVGGVPDSGAITVAVGTRILASATAAGTGGDVRLMAERTLRAYGSLAARGGPEGGDGGFIETSGGYALPAADIGKAGLGGGFDVRGIAVDAGAPRGKAGTWLIDPYDITIQAGAGPGAAPLNPFEPLADSVIQDGDINAALLTSNVTITTGVGGPPLAGDITFDDAQIVYTGAADRTFRLDANRSIRANGGTSIAAYDPVAGTPSGRLNVVFNANANNNAATTGGGQVSYDGTIYTNGGDVTMNGSWANTFNQATSVHLGQGSVVDTRRGNQASGLGGYTGGSNAQAGGNVTLVGRSTAAPAFGQLEAATWLDDTVITTSTGNVSVFGSSTLGSGVQVDNTQAAGGIFTTSGNIQITGIGSYTANSATTFGHGVVLGNTSAFFSALGQPTLQTTSGNIDVSGIRLAGGAQPGTGVLVGNRALVTTTGGGNITLTGESQGPGAGLVIQPLNNFSGLGIPGGRVVGSNQVVLRAVNDGSTDALVAGAGSQVAAGSVLNLRPGGLNVAGGPDNYTATAVDRTAAAITLGGAGGAGFSLSTDELATMTAPTTVVGSNAHAADITVQGALDFGARALTLQNGAGGNIALQAPVTAARLGLASAGNITQTAGAPIVAGTLLARSTGGSVLLDQAANNVSASTLGGGAAGAFRYQDVDDLRVGAVSVIGYDAAGNAPQVVSAGSMAADTVFVRTLSGDLQLGTAVTSTSGADLVAAARFQNVGGASLGGAPWRVWADTWVGETRGGLAGSGLLPNLYNCAYLGLCTVSVTPGDNHFIYARQPVATVVVNSATRPFGFPNPLFTYGITGLILGDTGASFGGLLSTTAGVTSLPGVYPISGTFASAAGYAVNVVPGSLRVSTAIDLPKVDVLRELPTSYLYDRNIGQAPICLATGPLDGDRAQQGADVLAREWSRVRSRPNLLNCVDTERRNGCADF